MNKITSNNFQMVAKTLYGLEDILAAELEDIGAKNILIMNRSVEFSGDMAILYKANLHLRCASRILKPIIQFKASNKDNLYHKVQKVNWSDYFGLRQTFAIDPLVINSDFDNSMYVAQVTKDAIVDQFREKTGKRPSVDKYDPDIRLNIYMNNNEATLSLDSSNIPLHKRGYRLEGGEAPMNEILAAGIIATTGWAGDCALMDGMCGSGTILIEAVMKARNIAPGLLRKHFGFMNWKDYNQKLFIKLTNEAKNNIKDKLDYPIIGSDISKRCIKESLSNADRAGVGRDISFSCQSFKSLTPQDKPGMLIINPPYGERMPVKEIGEFYQMIGDCLKQKYDGFDAYIFTGNLQAAKSIGLKTSRRIKFFNGPLECRLLKFEIYQGSRKKKYQNLSNNTEA